MSSTNSVTTTPETVTISFDIPNLPLTPQAKFIVEELIPEFTREFIRKSQDYQQSDGQNFSEMLGLPGQWVDLFRKTMKLKRPLWDNRGEGLESAFHFESAEEIVRDLIGHGFLTLIFLRKALGKES